jgi:hypothetical protein
MLLAKITILLYNNNGKKERFGEIWKVKK